MLTSNSFGRLGPNFDEFRRSLSDKKFSGTEPHSAKFSVALSQLPKRVHWLTLTVLS